MKKSKILIIAFSIIFLLVFGCADGQETKMTPVTKEQNIPADEQPSAENEGIKEDTQDNATEEAPKVTTVEPVRDRARYRTPDPSPSDEEKDTCGCSFKWDPVCGKDKKTYINRCMYECFGYSADDISVNAQCPKKNSTIKIFVDDIELGYEKDKWNGGYCWRDMYEATGIRYCENIIVNGRVNEEPEPSRGNWLDDAHLTMDKEGRKDSYTIKLETGQQATNEEYNLNVQPIFENGRYRFSFWARQDLTANNDWKVKLTLMDWWDEKPRPLGVEGCYKLMIEINGDEHFMDALPTEWRHYHYEFDVPLNMTQWSSQQRVSADCEYDWDMVPHGYGIEVTAPTIGYAMFDEFSLVKIK